MGLESYYKDHWVEIEEDRLDRYEQMFQWGPAFERYLAPAEIKPSQVVGDLGCGPGFLSRKLLRKFSPNGCVHSFNVNKDFSEHTHVKAKGLGDRLKLHYLTSETLPISDASLDRIIAKNVMVYADDPAHTFRKFRRVSKPSGKAHAIDSDFAMLAIDPVPPSDWRALLNAAAHAFRTPNIGRKLYGLAKAAGFSSVDAQIMSTTDTKGRLLNFTKKYRRVCTGSQHVRRTIDEQHLGYRRSGVGRRPIPSSVSAICSHHCRIGRTCFSGFRCHTYRAHQSSDH